MDKEFTHRFIEMNKLFVQDEERISKFPPKAIAMYKQFAKGRCFCGKKIFITNFVKTGSGTDWIFHCGHKLTVIGLQETKNEQTPHGDTHYSSELISGQQSEVAVQTTGEKQGKEESELAVVKLLSHFRKNGLLKFSQPETNSHIDVIGEDGTGNEEFFQVTRLYNQSFWHQLGKHEKASMSLRNEATILIKEAIGRKLSYPTELRQNLVLAIDCSVGLLLTDIDVNQLISIVTEANFKEIWLVGRTANLTIKLYPFN